MSPELKELQTIAALLRSMADKQNSHRALTFAEAAAEFGISQEKLRDATNKRFGKLPSFGKGKGKRLIRHHVREWIDAQATRN